MLRTEDETVNIPNDYTTLVMRTLFSFDFWFHYQFCCIRGVTHSLMFSAIATLELDGRLMERIPLNHNQINITAHDSDLERAKRYMIYFLLPYQLSIHKRHYHKSRVIERTVWTHERRIIGSLLTRIDLNPGMDKWYFVPLIIKGGTKLLNHSKISPSQPLTFVNR